MSLDFEKFKALIFDLDGTLIDSMAVHNLTWIETLGHFGLDISVKDLGDLAGISSLRTVEILNHKFKTNLDPVQVTNTKENLYLKRVKDVKIAVEVFDLVKKYFGKLPLAIVTGGERKVVSHVLSELSLERFFQVVTCADDTKEGKETPTPFLFTSDKLKVHPRECLFFDDGDVGLKGARQSGMQVVRVNLFATPIFSLT